MLFRWVPSYDFDTISLAPTAYTLLFLKVSLEGFGFRAAGLWT